MQRPRKRIAREEIESRVEVPRCHQTALHLYTQDYNQHQWTTQKKVKQSIYLEDDMYLWCVLLCGCKEVQVVNFPSTTYCIYNIRFRTNLNDNSIFKRERVLYKMLQT
eukprot:m.152263 g.152263  ORF g.152263 m.152263 type:complete len:108 (+) comp13300_c0_seq5:540-863(+)